MAAQGKNVLFVGTKRQAQEAIAEEATRCQMYYVNQRWLGGLLTNMRRCRSPSSGSRNWKQMAPKAHTAAVPKKESFAWSASANTSIQNLAGIKDMPGLPDVLFVIDSNKEAIAVKEARGWASRWSPSSIPTAIPTKSIG
jgi:small subunit ribosomal protein S2